MLKSTKESRKTLKFLAHWLDGGAINREVEREEQGWGRNQCVLVVCVGSEMCHCGLERSTGPTLFFLHALLS